MDRGHQYDRSRRHDGHDSEGLTPSTSYDVEVLAKNAEGASDWSNPGNGSTERARREQSARVHRWHERHAERERKLADRHAHRRSRRGDGRRLRTTRWTYRLEGRDAASFAINESNGQLLTKSGVTLIAGETYTVDGRGRRHEGTLRSIDSFYRGYRRAAEQPASLLGGR